MKLTWAMVLPAPLAAVTGPLAARALGPFGRGQAAAVVIYGMALPVILSFGLLGAIGQRAALEPERRPELVATSLLYALLTVPLTALVTIALMLGPLGSIHGSGRTMAILTLSIAPLSVLAYSLQGILQAEGALGPLARTRALPFILNFVLTVGLFFTGRLTVATYLATNVFASTAVLISTLCSVHDKPRWYYPLRPLLRFGLRGFVGTLANMANTRLDQMIMIPFLGSAQLGLYAVAATANGIPLTIGAAISTRSYGQIASAPDPQAETARYIRLTFLSMGVACGFAALAAPLLIPIVFGRAYRGAVTPLLLLLPGTATLATASISTGALNVFGHPGRPSWAEVAGVVVTVGGLLLFLHPFGIAGAAVVSSLSYGLTMALHAWFLRRLGVKGLLPGRIDVSWLAHRALPKRWTRRLAWSR